MLIGLNLNIKDFLSIFDVSMDNFVAFLWNLGRDCYVMLCYKKESGSGPRYKKNREKKKYYFIGYLLGWNLENPH